MTVRAGFRRRRALRAGRILAGIVVSVTTLGCVSPPPSGEKDSGSRAYTLHDSGGDTSVDTGERIRGTIWVVNAMSEYLELSDYGDGGFYGFTSGIGPGETFELPVEPGFEFYVAVFRTDYSACDVRGPLTVTENSEETITFDSLPYLATGGPQRYFCDAE